MLRPVVILSLLLAFSFVSYGQSVQNVEHCSAAGCTTSSVSLAGRVCGNGPDEVSTTIDFGCSNKGNPITDLLFAVIRFLSAGVGLVIVVSVIIGGIQYIVSRGDPNATQAAIKRLTSAVMALLLFIFAYAILNYVIPGGLFK